MPNPMWLTYAWKDNDDGDFHHLVARLEEAGLDVAYDRIQLVPGRRLWDQIAARITSGDIAGWAYLVTPASLASQACREELAYALDRALRSTEEEFPLIGLIHGVPVDELPTALRVRFCVDVADPDWVDAVVAAIEGRPPKVEAPDPGGIRLDFHQSYGADGSYGAFEFRPRFGEVTYWRLAFPVELADASVGSGPAGGGAVGGNMENYVDGNTEIEGMSMRFVGSGNTLTPGTSAYLSFHGQPPSAVCFGVSSQPYELPEQWTIWRVGAAG